MAADLCSGAWAKRNATQRDLVAYGEAWCRIRARDEAAGVDSLGQLARSKLTREDIRRASRLDAINLVASAMTADAAVDRLRIVGLAAPGDLDLLAATYGALGLRREVTTVLETIAAEQDEWKVTREQRCERLLAWEQLTQESSELLDLVANGDDRCSRRARATACALAEGRDSLLAIRECFNELPATADLERRAWLIVAAKRWDRAQWLEVARDARNALPLDGAEELAVSALEAARRDASMGPAARGPRVPPDALRAEAQALLDHDQHAPRFDVRLRALLK